MFHGESCTGMSKKQTGKVTTVRKEKLLMSGSRKYKIFREDVSRALPGKTVAIALKKKHKPKYILCMTLTVEQADKIFFLNQHLQNMHPHHY